MYGMVLGIGHNRALWYTVVWHGVGYGVGYSIMVSSCTAWCWALSRIKHYGTMLYGMVLGIEQD